jgi:hypothetical protein
MKNSLIEPKAGEPRRLIAFPESSHEEVSRIFVNGGYRAIIEPANFIGRWRQDFGRRSLADLLKQSGIVADDDFVVRLERACRERSRAATEEDISRFVSLKAAEAKRAKEPTEFLLAAVPVCFDSRGLVENLCRPSAGSDRERSGGPSGVGVGRRFWDYAGVAVPPVAFKGGSDLVVFKSTPQPFAAFALADFLATDPEFTSVLAEAGHLPAGRPGYGIDILVGTMSGRESDAETQQFARDVQKAIDQGRTYPPIDVWPTAVENKQVLEALQNVWRRMGEQNADGLRDAARQAEWTINSRIHWGYWFVDRIAQAWQVIAVVLVVALVAVAFLIIARIRADRAAVLAQKKQVEAQAAVVQEHEERVNSEAKRIEAEGKMVLEAEKRVKAVRDLSLSLNLLMAHRHEAAKYLGDNLRELAEEAAFNRWDTAEVIGRVQRLSELFEEQLVPHIDDVSRNQLRELTGQPARLGLKPAVDKAYNGARYVFEAKNRRTPPYVHFSPEGLSGWYIETLPHAAVMILEEWFLNCIKYFHWLQMEGAEIKVWVCEGPLLCIRSSGSMSEEEAAVLLQEPWDAAVINNGHQGLTLIRNILRYAYGVSASITTADGEVELRIPLPLGREVLVTTSL